MDDARRDVGPETADITLATLAALTPEERIAVYRGLLGRPGLVTGALREQLASAVLSHDILVAYREGLAHDRDAAEGRVAARPGSRWARALDRVIGPGVGVAFGASLYTAIRARHALDQHVDAARDLARAVAS